MTVLPFPTPPQPTTGERFLAGLERLARAVDLLPPGDPARADVGLEDYLDPDPTPPQHDADVVDLRAVLSAAPTDTTKETDR